MDKGTPLSNLGWMLTRQGKWKDAEYCFQQALESSDERSQAAYRGNIGRLYELQENYSQAELELLYRLEILERNQELQNLSGYTGIMLSYALSGNVEESKHYLEIARTIFDWETRLRRKWWCLYEIAEGHRILGELEEAKTACQQSLEWFSNSVEQAEETIYLAEARLVMGKILVDTRAYQEAETYLEQARTAFRHCHHYALGTAYHYLGKATLGKGGDNAATHAATYLHDAIAEFQRLDLHHKERATREELEKLE